MIESELEATSKVMQSDLLTTVANEPEACSWISQKDNYKFQLPLWLQPHSCYNHDGHPLKVFTFLHYNVRSAKEKFREQKCSRLWLEIHSYNITYLKTGILQAVRKQSDRWLFKLVAFEPLKIPNETAKGLNFRKTTSCTLSCNVQKQSDSVLY